MSYQPRRMSGEDPYKKMRRNYEEASKNYKYPHDYGGYVEQQYLPDEMLGTKYYNPNNGEVNLDEIRNDFKKE